MIKFSRGLVRIGWIAVGSEDCIFLGSWDAARAISVRSTASDGSISPGVRVGSDTVQKPLDLSISILRQCCAEAMPTSSTRESHLMGQFLTHLVIQREYHLGYVCLSSPNADTSEDSPAPHHRLVSLYAIFQKGWGAGLRPNPSQYCKLPNSPPIRGNLTGRLGNLRAMPISQR